MPTINRKPLTIHKQSYNHENKSAIFYNSKSWHILRNDYLSEHPLCEECLSKGIIKEAKHIHHIKPFLSGKTESERWELLLDESNLQALCLDCHHDKHK